MAHLPATIAFAIAIVCSLPARGQSAAPQDPMSGIHPEKPSGNLSALPPLPAGKSTVIGGAIRNVDQVRDQMTLKVYGAKKPMKILFDARTLFYRDGTRTPLRDLRPEEHASVQTVLDGTDVYAISIHILSKSPEGECDGQVVSFNPATGELSVSPALSREPILLRVPAGTSILRRGKYVNTPPTPTTVADLVQEALVSVRFTASSGGRGVTRQIEVIATPGSTFAFSGNITFLDVHAHTLALTDPLDGQNYTISFDPGRFPVARDLRQGMHVTIQATFDGSHYAADSIAAK
jgi:hypothetical protein